MDFGSKDDYFEAILPNFETNSIFRGSFKWNTIRKFRFSELAKHSVAISKILYLLYLLQSIAEMSHFQKFLKVIS